MTHKVYCSFETDGRNCTNEATGDLRVWNEVVYGMNSRRAGYQDLPICEEHLKIELDKPERG